MDFLDPKLKKSHRRRLLIGYVLMAVAVAMGTLILLFTAYGFDINHQTGDIIQNGTIFVDSSPGGGTIALNGQVQRSKTASRLVLPGGQQYSIKLSLDGYRDWNRTLSLEGGKIERVVYPLLIPKTLSTSEIQLYAVAPNLSSQSPDRRWLLVQQAGQTYQFDLYDLNNPTTVPALLTIPSSILTDSTKPATLAAVEWSNDNHHLLMDRSFNGTHEFLMIDTTSIANSLNIDTALAVAPTSVSLRDKKADQLYVYDAASGGLRIGDLKNRTVSSAILSGILAYKSFGADIIFYATTSQTAPEKVNYRIREDDKATYLLKSAAAGASYALDVSEFDGTPYFVLASQQDGAAFIYRDPLPTLKGQSQTPLLVSAVLRVDNPQFVSFSPTGQYVLAQSGNKLVSYDIEGDRQFKFGLSHVIEPGSKLAWMDSARVAFTSTKQGYMIDFDGSNEQSLVPSISSSPVFAPDYKTMFTLAPSVAVTGRFALTQTSLIKK